MTACVNNPRILLVGLKRDLRNDTKFIEEQLKPRNETPITTEEGYKMAKRNACMGYYETSSVKMENVVKLHECMLNLVFVNGKI